MSLPKIDLPLFEITIPSSGKKTTYRPFTVKEEKILLLAQETKELDQIILAIKQIIGNCVDGVNVNDLPMFDLEYIMINIRAKSVNNALKFTIVDEETKENVELNLDLNNITLKIDENHNKKIVVNDQYTLIMKYPSIDQLKELSGSNQNDAILNMMISCIDLMMSNDGDKIYKFSEFSKKEITEFVESLSSKTIMDIRTFFETMPVLRVELPYTNKNGNKKTFVLEGLNSFFI